jgi:hypothetical protein
VRQWTVKETRLSEAGAAFLTFDSMSFVAYISNDGFAR